MLDTKDYEQYKSGLQRALTLPKYFLSKWAYYENNVSSLTNIEVKQAKQLYAVLGHLTEEERTFLARKYRSDFTKKYTNSKKYKTDDEVAKDLNMTKKDYIKLRRGVEYKFFHYLQNYVDENIVY